VDQSAALLPGTYEPGSTFLVKERDSRDQIFVEHAHLRLGLFI
jgi:hypothetical protein